MKLPFLGVAGLIAVGHFLSLTLLVLPSVYRAGGFPTVPFLLSGVGCWLLFAGGFVQVVGRVLAQVPAVPVGDERLDEHPWDGHVHAYGAHH